MTAALPTRNRHGVRYFDAGTSGSGDQTLLLLHGLGNSLDYWTGVAPTLAQEVRTIAVDIPGFGMSRLPAGGLSLSGAAKDIWDLVRELGAAEIRVIAHSMGTYVALQMAAEQKSLVRHITLINGTLFRAHEAISSPSKLLANPSLCLAVIAQFVGGLVPLNQVSADVIARSRLSRRVFLWPYVADPAELDPKLLAFALAGNAGRSIWASIGLARQLSLVELSNRAIQSVDVLWGDADRLIANEDIAMARSALRIRREVKLSGCGHWPMLEAPRVLCDYILSGLR